MTSAPPTRQQGRLAWIVEVDLLGWIEFESTGFHFPHRWATFAMWASMSSGPILCALYACMHEETRTTPVVAGVGRLAVGAANHGVRSTSVRLHLITFSTMPTIASCMCRVPHFRIRAVDC